MATQLNLHHHEFFPEKLRIQAETQKDWKEVEWKGNYSCIQMVKQSEKKKYLIGMEMPSEI